MDNNRISRQLADYLAYKRSLGFKLTHEATVLNRFAEYTAAMGYDGPLNTNIALSWVASGRQSDKTMGRKLEVLRPFSKYVYSFDPEAEVISTLIYKNVHDRPIPYIYSEQEVLLLMEECKKLHSPDGIRAYTIETVIGLLWSTGLRPSEPVRLTMADVDLGHGLLNIRKTKFSKDWLVPIHAGVASKLLDYKSWIISKLGHKHPTEPFFYTTGGVPLKENGLAYAFKLIRPCIGAEPIGYPHVRLYDFRHTMACNTIRKWAEQGIDVNTRLHVLSTYMGHVKPEDTYWYLSATPEMLELSCRKYETQFGGGPDEI